LGQRLGVDGVGLGALEQRLGELVRLGGIDHTHRVPRIVEMQGEGHPVGVRRFQHHQYGRSRQMLAPEVCDEIGEPGGYLHDGERGCDGARIGGACDVGARRSDIDTDEYMLGAGQ